MLLFYRLMLYISDFDIEMGWVYNWWRKVGVWVGRKYIEKSSLKVFCWECIGNLGGIGEEVVVGL